MLYHARAERGEVDSTSPCGVCWPAANERNRDAVQVYILANGQRNEQKVLSLKLVAELMAVYEVEERKVCLQKVLTLEREFGGD